MKKALLIIAGILAWGAVAFATITLSTSQVQTYQVGGAAVETDGVASAASARTDFAAGQITAQVNFGSTSSGSFVAGKLPQPLTITIYAKNGTVTVSNGTVIKLTAAQQTAVQAFITNFQDNLESALVAWGVTPGTAVAN